MTPYAATDSPEDRLAKALADAGSAIEAIPHDYRHEAIEKAFAKVFPDRRTERDFTVGVMLIANERRITEGWMRR